MESVKQILNAWCEASSADLIANYRAKGLKASGNFERNIKVDSKDNEASISAPKYIGALVNGRSATKNGGGGGQSLRSLIRQWIDNKGITPSDGISKDSLAFLISRKIHRDGIKVPNKYNDGKLMSDTFTPDRVNTLKSQLGNFYVTSIKSTIQESWRHQ